MILLMLGIAVGVALDASAVAIAASIALYPVTRRQVFRFAFHFGLFQTLMPIIGWALGQTAASLIRAWDHWIAFALLSVVGLKAIYEAFAHDDAAETRAKDPTRGWSLVIFSVATSVDALAVGFTFVAMGVNVWQTAVLMGLVTALFTALGMKWGAFLGARLGRWAEIVGGGVLIAIGVRMLVTHLMP
ncbi:MAG TPA: manganese efflux pump MntP family protein [Candidatus Hydrogenedentes bacterium]|nr:manganese efflux pump MntP family protein [Candidatus Hydrogenedentota bacterium]HPG68255.1 manganese efflux pump MntP family protein [Candidatus Hydrogenedentota bacterium]